MLIVGWRAVLSSQRQEEKNWRGRNCSHRAETQRDVKVRSLLCSLNKTGASEVLKVKAQLEVLSQNLYLNGKIILKQISVQINVFTSVDIHHSITYSHFSSSDSRINDLKSHFLALNSIKAAFTFKKRHYREPPKCTIMSQNSELQR